MLLKHIIQVNVKGGDFMQMERVLIQLPKPLKAKLDVLRQQGYTASGYIRALLERELNAKEGKTHGRQTS
jgi:metal-responsive CopG/Arc/MetJ family transcriptional regulator